MAVLPGKKREEMQPQNGRNHFFLEVKKSVKFESIMCNIYTLWIQIHIDFCRP